MSSAPEEKHSVPHNNSEFEHLNESTNTSIGTEDTVDLEKLENEYDQEQQDAEGEEDTVEDLNYLVYNRPDLLSALQVCESEEDILAVRKKVIAIREAFIKISEKEKEEALENFLEEGGVKEEFNLVEDETSKSFFQILENYNKKKAKLFKNLDKERENNFRLKCEILNQLKNLIQHEEDITKAFNEFHEIQNRWRSTGPVPYIKSQDLWMTYKHYTDSFYEFIKLNRQLQELDWRRNLEIKIQICEQAESLLLEPSIGIALKQIQQLKNQWHDSGQVPRENRSEIGSRFKSAIDKVIERKKQLVESNKELQSKSKEDKEELCKRIEEIVQKEIEGNISWQKKITEVLNLQTKWKKAGYAGKEFNDLLWERFKGSCDTFFNKKSEQNKKRRNEFQKNLQLKLDLTIQAEALKNSTDWKIATDEFIKLQKEWKKIGYAGEKQGNEIWNRFKAAADSFFEAKKAFFSNIDQEYENNLSSKISLLEKIEKYEPDADEESTLEKLKEYQRDWLNIGLVPIKEKDKLQKRYRNAIDKQFQKIGISDQRKSKILFNEKISHLKESEGTGRQKLSAEKQHLKKKLTELNNDVQLWENNLGFFAKSKNAESIRTEFESKINSAKKEIDNIKEKLELLKSSLESDKN